MKNKHYIRVFYVIIGMLLVIIFGVFLNLFVIGEPIDAVQVDYTISADNKNLELRVAAIESAVALRGWKFNQDGSTLYISARKVLASPLFNEGNYETSIDLGLIENITFCGQVIWSKLN